MSEVNNTEHTKFWSGFRFEFMETTIFYFFVSLLTVHYNNLLYILQQYIINSNNNISLHSFWADQIVFDSARLIHYREEHLHWYRREYMIYYSSSLLQLNILVIVSKANVYIMPAFERTLTSTCTQVVLYQ